MTLARNGKIRSMRLEGHFSIMSFADLVQWARTAQKTGELKVATRGGRGVDVLFSHGRVVYSSNTALRKTYSRYLVFLDLCSQDAVDEALEEGRRTGEKLGALLVERGLLQPGLAIATLTQKTFEDLCEPFLWPEGSFSFEPTPVPEEGFLPVDIDPIRVVTEGLHRLEEWSRLQASIHDSKIFDRDAPRLPTGAQWHDVLVVRTVFSVVDGRHSVEEIVERLPFSRYKILRALADLSREGVIVDADQTELGQRESHLRRQLDGARAAREEGRWAEAVSILEGLSLAYPGREGLAAELVSALDGFRESIYSHSFGLEDVPVITLGADALVRLDLDAAAGFLLSRIDGRTTVSELLKIVPLDETEALRVLKRLRNGKVIDFPLQMRADDPQWPFTLTPPGT